MRAVIIHATHDQPGKKDATRAFRPEAYRFARAHGIPTEHVHGFDNRRSLARRREEVEGIIWDHPFDALDLVAIFCHGTRRSLQTGHSLADLPSLASTISMRSDPAVRVALYCCSTAAAVGEDERRPGPGGDSGPADTLRDLLSTLGCEGGWVDAHATVGHTTRNPFARRFYCLGNRSGNLVDGHGGDWIVPPGSPEWHRWVNALWSRREPKDIRLQFPLLPVSDIRIRLTA